MSKIKCGNCKATHGSVEAVRLCYGGATIEPCYWLIEGWIEDFDGGHKAIIECGADAIYDGRGFECVAGHSHVAADVRQAEGWDYAEYRGEAAALVRAGTEPRDLVTGGAFRW